MSRLFRLWAFSLPLSPPPPLSFSLSLSVYRLTRLWFCHAGVEENLPCLIHQTEGVCILWRKQKPRVLWRKERRFVTCPLFVDHASKRQWQPSYLQPSFSFWLQMHGQHQRVEMAKEPRKLRLPTTTADSTTYTKQVVRVLELLLALAMRGLLFFVLHDANY